MEQETSLGGRNCGGEEQNNQQHSLMITLLFFTCTYYMHKHIFTLAYIRLVNFFLYVLSQIFGDPKSLMDPHITRVLETPGPHIPSDMGPSRPHITRDMGTGVPI